MKRERIKFNTFSFISTFARAIVETFISLFLFKNGFSIKEILLFYLIENFAAIFISYFFVWLGEKTKYSIVMYIGIVAFIILQISLNFVSDSLWYLILISLLYSIFRRGYWLARRFYITNVIPQTNSTEVFSITLILSQISSILAGYCGAFFLDKFTILPLTIISSVLLFISVIPLVRIKYKNTGTKIELLKNLKQYDKRNLLAFSLYELNNLISFLFPRYIALYIKNTYTLAGSINAISKVAVIIFIFVYGKIIKKKNHFVLSTLLSLLLYFSKLFFLNYFVLIICFLEGFIGVMQTQSNNKIYFENRNGVDATHCNLLYNIIESIARSIAIIPLFFIDSIKIMIIIVIGIIGIQLLVYSIIKKGKKLN